MGRHAAPRRGGRVGATRAAVAMAAAGVTVLGFQARGAGAADPEAPTAAAVAFSPAAPAAPADPPAAAAETTASASGMPAPATVRVPRVKIEAQLDPLHLGPALELVAPDYGRAGWYRNGPEPGEPGRAVIAGHLDSDHGKDVFWDLHAVRRGDRVLVDLVDGRTLRFVVTSVGQYPRAEFPSERVYGGPGKAVELRLVTCGGPYDHERGYRDNVVVFATLA